MAKKYDVSIKVGEYTDSTGKVRARRKNIGVINEGNGGLYMLLDATVLSMPLFALANKERKESVICSLFEVKDEQAPASKPAEPISEELNDEIPF